MIGNKKISNVAEFYCMKAIKIISLPKKTT